VQSAAQKAADQQVPRDDEYQAATAINSVEPGTGDVKAMAVNRFFSEQKKKGHTKVNLAIGGSSGMQAGSTFKPFVLTAALQQGIPLGLSLYAPNKYTSDVFQNYTDKGIEPYTLGNAGDSQAGTYDLRSGTWNSVNTFYVQLSERVGLEAPPALAESLGLKQFKNGVPSAPLLRGGAFTLGVDEVSPLSLAAAYATFAGRGLYCPPRAVREILDSKNQPIELTQEPCRQVFDQGIADTVNSVLQGVIAKGTGKDAGIGRPAAGKTGSTNGSRAAWFAGYTPDLATTVWVGKAQPENMQRVTINGRYYRQVYGGTLPAAIWRETMRSALEGVPERSFEQEDAEVADGEEVRIPNVRGMPYDVAVAEIQAAGLRTRSGGRVSASYVQRGDVPYTFPRIGSSVPAGSSVIVYIASGRSRASRSGAELAETSTDQVQPAETRRTRGKGKGNGRR
jgi:membrane peptidoglycan carboxypeptidase